MSLEFVGDTITEQGIIIPVMQCAGCGERTTGGECRNCRMRDAWDDARMKEEREFQDWRVDVNDHN